MEQAQDAQLGYYVPGMPRVSCKTLDISLLARYTTDVSQCRIKLTVSWDKKEEESR